MSVIFGVQRHQAIIEVLEQGLAGYLHADFGVVALEGSLRCLAS
jgi:hypothetical protein